METKEHPTVEKKKITPDKCVVTGKGEWYFPLSDIYETPDNFTILIDMPGVGTDNISIDLRDNELVISLVVLGAGGSIFMQEPWQLYLFWGFIVGAGSGGTSIVMGSAIINRWFQKRRGLALGVLGAAFSSGQLIFTPVLMNLNIHQGWRVATLFIVLLLGLIILPLVIRLMVDDPGLKGMRPYGANGFDAPPVRPDPSPMRLAMANPQFWLLAFSFGICGFTTSGLFQTHLIPHGIEHVLRILFRLSLTNSSLSRIKAHFTFSFIKINDYQFSCQIPHGSHKK